MYTSVKTRLSVKENSMVRKFNMFHLFFLCFLIADNIRARQVPPVETISDVPGASRTDVVPAKPALTPPSVTQAAALKPKEPVKPTTIGPKPTAIVKEPEPNPCCPQPLPICCPKPICYKPIVIQPRTCCPKPVCNKPYIPKATCYPRCVPCNPAPCCLPTICYRARPICVKPVYCRRKPACCPKVRCCRPKPPCCPRPLPPCPKPACIPPAPVCDYLPPVCPCPAKPAGPKAKTPAIPPAPPVVAAEAKSISKFPAPASTRSLATREITQAELQPKK